MRTVIGVMGGAFVSELTLEHAEQLGRGIAERGWTLLTGGRDAGVMAAASRGAASAGGLVIGVLPGEDPSGAAPHVDVAICTGMGDGRNVVNVLSSHVVVALPGGAGTVSEIALALKAGRTVITHGFPMGPELHSYYERGQLIDSTSVAETLGLVGGIVGKLR